MGVGTPSHGRIRQLFIVYAETLIDQIQGDIATIV